MADEPHPGLARSRRSIHSRKFSADLGAIPAERRRRSLSFSWILYGHTKLSSSAASFATLHEAFKLSKGSGPHSTLDDCDYQVRLVHLQPGNSTDGIVCNLATVNISNPGPFEALSYCWGDNRDLRLILFYAVLSI
jgi:hypothetical protein